MQRYPTMRWEAEWFVTRMPTRPQLEALAAALCVVEGVAAVVVAWDDDGDARIGFKISTARAASVPAQLGDTASADDVARGLLPPAAVVDEAALATAGLLTTFTLAGDVVPGYLPGHERFAVVPDVYTLRVNVVQLDDEGDHAPRVQVYGNDGDNRAAWAVVHALGMALADRLGIVGDDLGDELDDDRAN